MKKYVQLFLQTFFGKELELRVKFFNVLAMTGFLICITMTGVSIVSGMAVSAWINLGAGLVSLFLLICSVRSGCYRFCYSMTILVIFLILFPNLFLFGGGYKGGMPFFFVFAVVFTVYMLDGWVMLLSAGAELVVYAALCILAYCKPQWIVPFDSAQAELEDLIIGMVTVSISLGATMFIQLRMYQKQQKELEKAKQAAESASKAKSAFLANMSHEIRTPIHMILGMNEIIRQESRGEQEHTYAQKIHETGKMLLSLVDSILDVSKIESSKMELMPAPYESDQLVRALELIGRTNCSKKGLEFCCRVPRPLPPVLEGDLARVCQIGSNYLSNACKYTEQGKVTLTLSWEPEEEKQILLKISVTDTGIGIRRDVLPTLFDAFTRVDLEAHRDIEGTGLGLAIVKELAQLMGGVVSVESQEGKGSTFSALIPQKVQNITPLPRKQMSFRAPQAKVLAVDDNEDNRTIMKYFLGTVGIHPDLAASGQECIELVRKKTYHVIFMDYMMPQLNGLETLQHLQQDPNFAVPVVALTADATQETEQKLLKGGFAAYLTKPYSPQKLKDVLRSCLPQELVTEVAQADPQEIELCSQWEQRLQKYGIILEEGLAYFSGDLQAYCKLAEVFVRHAPRQRQEARQFWEEENHAQLRFCVHALKGKAKNLGLSRLAQVSGYLEQLCAQEKTAELQSLMPYLLYLWESGAAGLGELLRTQTIEPLPQLREEADPGELLPGFLRGLRRRPSLQCISQILKTESDPAAKALLQQTQQAVEAIAFEEAQEKFQSYLDLKKEKIFHDVSGTHIGD